MRQDILAYLDIQDLFFRARQSCINDGACELGVTLEFEMQNATESIRESPLRSIERSWNEDINSQMDN